MGLNGEAALDALAWAGFTEQAVIAKLANKLVREHDEWGYPTKKTFENAIRNTSPKRGRAGPMLPLLEEEFKRQRPIYWQRKRDHDEWDSYLKLLSDRGYRLNAAYASRFGRAIHLGHRNCPLPYHAPHEVRQKWQDAEQKRDKGDECKGLIIHQGCTVALVTTTHENGRPQIRVRYPSGKTFTTYLRDRCEDFGSLFTSLGGRPVTGALAHGHRVDIDYRGRRFVIHHPSGETVEAPWLARKFVETTGGFREEVTDIVIVGRRIEGEEPVEDEG